jgi:peptide/nickel transport system substrate-binding protein
MNPTRIAIPLVVLAALCAAPGSPPAVAQDQGKKPIAGVGYDPKDDPLVNPPTLLQPYDAAAATEEDWLVMTFDGNPKTTNGIAFSSNDEFTVSGLLYDGPFTFDKDLKWKMNDYFAESLKISDDKRVWTLKLKPGLKWHDGQPFTAHDIAFTYDQIMDPNVVSAQKSGTDELASVKALDDLTVEYVVKAPTPISKWAILYTIIPKHLYEKGKKEDATLKTSPYYAELNRKGVGNGPYRLLEWKENDKLVFERWDDYPGPKPHHKRVICKIIPDQNVQLFTFEGGEVDEVELIAKHFADATVRSEKFKKIGYKAWGQQWQYSYIGWNADGSNPFFNDKRVRYAMTHATNVKMMIEKILYNLNPQCHGIWHPDSPMFCKEIKLLPFDLDKAAALLDEAGWEVSDEDGWRYKNKTKFSFTLMIPQGVVVSQEVAAILQQDLKSLGVEMKTQPMEWATWQERSRKHEFQANIAAWGTGAYPDISENIWHSKYYSVEGGRNYVGYKNPRVDELFEAAVKEFDEAKRMKMFAEIQKLIYEDQPYTFLWNRPTLWGFNRRLRGVVFSPRGVLHFDPSNLAWWTAKGEQAYGAR